MVIIFLICIAFILGEFPPFSILSTARGYFYLVLVFSIFKNKEIKDINYIYYIVFGSTIGWMILGLLQVNEIRSNIAPNQDVSVVYGNMIALALAISIVIVFKKRIHSLITFIAAIIISITVGLRRQIFVTLISYLLSYLTQISFNIKRAIALAFSISLIVFSLISLYPIAKDYTYNISPMLYYRIFVKSEQFVTGDISESDQTRMRNFTTFTNEIENYILPRGLVSKRTGEDAGTGVYIDFPLLEFFHVFGILFGVPLIFIFTRRIVFHFNNYYNKGIRESAVSLVMFGVVIALMFLEGTFLNYAYATPVTGFVVARIMSTKNLIK